jgi:hypothetical protein
VLTEKQEVVAMEVAEAAALEPALMMQTTQYKVDRQELAEAVVAAVPTNLV